VTGHIRRRGARSWEIKFSLGTDPATGKRITRYHSFKGTKREAERKLTQLLKARDDGTDIEPSKQTLADFLDRWETWAATQVSAITLERYREIIALHVRPHLGAIQVQKLRPLHLAELYGRLQRPKDEGGAGLRVGTVRYVHAVLSRTLALAVRWNVIAVNPASTAEPPRAAHAEIEILSPEQIQPLLETLRDRPIYIIAVVGLATGMRRGEMLALRWGDVDLDHGSIRVERSIEQTNRGLAFKAPKTRAGRRTVSIPSSVAAELRQHWREQQEMRLQLALGRAGAKDLVFPRPDGSLWPPDSLSVEWRDTIRALKLPKVTLHGLRHTHVSQLIAAGLDIVSVSRRIGHANATITLGVYGHLYGNTDDKAAAIVEAALSSALGVNRA
jgi:integrase